MERSFAREVELLKLGLGETFHGEGIVAVTKALLQSGVSYVGGYQGSPISHLLDVMVEAKPYLSALGVHVEPCTNEAAACAMLAASVNYPVRGAVTWKSIVGTNVASDALANLCSPGVQGGALIVVGEDYGEGSSVVQERTHAFAMKSSAALFDPRPDLGRIVDCVEHAFALSEASHLPAILQLRIRACHLQGSFVCKDNVAPEVSSRQRIVAPAKNDPNRMSHPPYTFAHERQKVMERLPAARRYIVEHRLNERFGRDADIGVIVQGGLYNTLMRALETADLVDGDGNSVLPLWVLNVTYPLVHEELAAFCSDKRAVLLCEEGHPEFIEFELATMLERAQITCAIRGKHTFNHAGEYGPETMLGGLQAFLGEFAPELDRGAIATWRVEVTDVRKCIAPLFGQAIPPRPPGFCVGCPERPVFAALKLTERTLGPRHMAADIGCHSFAMFEPFELGHSILGYGMGLASAAGVGPLSGQRPLATVGDGGLWHNGLLSGVVSAVKNNDDAVLLVFENGYTSATGTQELISTPKARRRERAGGASTTATDTTIERTLRSVGVPWVRTVHTYDVAQMRATLEEAFTTPRAGLKAIVAEGECQLERQRRRGPLVARQLEAGERTVSVRYGIDEDVCIGDRACIRLSGCPSLTLKTPSDPLRVDPVTTIDAACVGCGLCGELAHTAALCPSFHRIELVRNASAWERFKAKLSAFALKMVLPA